MKKLEIILNELKPTSILDIGSGTGKYLYYCYHILPQLKKRLHGIEKEKHSSIFSSYSLLAQGINSNEFITDIKVGKISSNYDYYKNYIERELKLIPKSKQEFERDINIEYGVSFNHSTKKLGLIDLILAIRVIHYFNEYELDSFISFCNNKLQHNGYIFIVISQNISNRSYTKKWLESIFNQNYDFKTIGFDTIEKENYILFKKDK